MIFFNHRRVSLVIADDMVPIWRQDIYTNHDDAGWLIQESPILTLDHNKKDLRHWGETLLV